MWRRKREVYNTKYSQAVTHPSTNFARPGLTSVIRREPVFFVVFFFFLNNFIYICTICLISNLVLLSISVFFICFQLTEYAICVFINIVCLAFLHSFIDSSSFTSVASASLVHHWSSNCCSWRRWHARLYSYIM